MASKLVLILEWEIIWEFLDAGTVDRQDGVLFSSPFQEEMGIWAVGAENRTFVVEMH